MLLAAISDPSGVKAREVEGQVRALYASNDVEESECATCRPASTRVFR
jgi:hypothetical protein